jgi:hypothetical protein
VKLSFFKTLYESPIQHPLAAWTAAALTTTALLVGRPRLWRLGLVLVAITVFDAFITGAFSPLATGSPLSGVLAFVFVVAGDMRFFFLVERQQRPLSIRKDPTRGQALITAFGLSLAVPALSFALRLVVPQLISSDRAFFLSYELAFIVVAVLMALSVRKNVAPSPMRRWMLALCAFEAVQYGAWAAGDMLLLTGDHLGYLSRIVGNVLYYMAFVPFAVFTAPEDALA